MLAAPSPRVAPGRGTGGFGCPALCRKLRSSNLGGSMLSARTVSIGAAVLVASLTAASCSGSPQSTTGTTTTSVSAHSGPPTSARPTAVNLVVTDAIRQQLVAALAASISVPPSEYTGLAPGLTYYALDKATDTHWAAAKPVPAPSSNPSSPTRAQVSSQDEGAYDVFSQPAGGSWTVHATGNAGQSPPCGVTIPPQVLRVWGWAPGSCRPVGA